MWNAFLPVITCKGPDKSFVDFLKFIKLLSHCNRRRTQNHLVCKWALNHLAKLAKWLSYVMSTYLYCTFGWCFYHVWYVFQSESTLYSCLNVKEFLAWSKCDIRRLSDSNRTQTQNHLVHKRTLNHFAKLAKWLSCVVSTYLYGAFGCVFLSSHIHISEWIHTPIVVWISKRSTVYPNWSNGWAALRVLICTVHFTVCFYHIMYAFQSEATLCNCLNFKELID